MFVCDLKKKQYTKTSKMETFLQKVKLMYNLENFFLKNIICPKFKLFAIVKKKMSKYFFNQKV